MKKFKKLIPAMVMLLIATMLMGTTTYAWFSMNTKVTVTGMEVKARAEGGLLVSATAQDGTWANTAAITLGKEVQLLPASTADGTNWYHAHSKTSSSAIAFLDGDGYYLLTNGSGGDVAPTGSAIPSHGTLYTASENLYSVGSSAAKIVYDENGTTNGYDAGEDDGFYLATDYYLRSSGTEIAVGSTQKYKALAINQVTISSITGSVNLDKCLRIAVVILDGNTPVSNLRILAPVNGANGVTATANAQSTTGAHNTDSSALVGLCSSGVTTYYANANLGLTANIPANTSGEYLTARVFVWFEGEDSTCISDNITATLDTLSIEVSFKLVESANQYNDIATSTEP